MVDQYVQMAERFWAEHNYTCIIVIMTVGAIALAAYSHLTNKYFQEEESA